MGILATPFNPEEETRLKRRGNRIPGSTPPGAPVRGDIWYDTGTGILKVWSGSVWKDVGGAYYTNGVELYHPSSTPFIDFHRAANPAGDSNADYNVRIINEQNDVLHIYTASGGRWGAIAVGSTKNATIGAYGWDSNWAHFGSDESFGTSTGYAFMSHKDGDTIVSARGATYLRSNAASDRITLNSSGVNIKTNLMMEDHYLRLRGVDDNHVLTFDAGIDGPNLWGNSGARIGTNDGRYLDISNGRAWLRFVDGTTDESRLYLEGPCDRAYGHLLNLGTFRTGVRGGDDGPKIFFRNNSPNVLKNYSMGMLNGVRDWFVSEDGGANDGYGAGEGTVRIRIWDNNAFEVWGPVWANSYNNNSSLEGKQSVTTLSEKIDVKKLKKIRPIHFFRKNTDLCKCDGDPDCHLCEGRIDRRLPEQLKNDSTGYFSFAAEEIAEIFPEAVAYSCGEQAGHPEDPDTMRPTGIDIMGMVGLSWTYIQELESQLEALKKEITNLKKK